MPKPPMRLTPRNEENVDRWRVVLQAARRRLRREQEDAMHARSKKLHYSPAGREAIVCGVTKRGGWRVRFTKVREDITCDLCAKVLEAEEGKMAASNEAEDEKDQIDDDMMTEAKKLAAKFYRQRFEELFRHLGFDASKCKACKRTIFWVKHANGKNVPYTIDGQNHFADCSQADAFRKGKKK